MYQYSDLLKNRRSIRKFTAEPVSMTELEEIIQETCIAPSATNAQPWRFIIIQDQAVMKKISDESKKNLVELLKNIPDTDPDAALKSYVGMLSNPKFNVFYNAPCLVLIVSNHTTNHVQYDLGLAAAYFMFAATSRNLGTCWIGLGDQIKDPTLRAEIGLADDYTKIVPLIIGHPMNIPPMSERAKPIILKKI